MINFKDFMLFLAIYDIEYDTIDIYDELYGEWIDLKYLFTVISMSDRIVSGFSAVDKNIAIFIR